MKFKFGSRVTVKGDGFFGGVNGQVVNYQHAFSVETQTEECLYLVIADQGGTQNWFSEEHLEPVPVFRQLVPSGFTYVDPSDL